MSNIRKIAPFVLGNMSTPFLASKMPFSRPRTFSETGQHPQRYLIIWSHPDLSIVSRLRSEGINLKSHRLNPISLKIAHSMFVFLSNVYYFYSSVVFPILRPFPCSGRRKPVFESQLAYSCRRYPHSSRVSFLPPKKQSLKN